MVEKMFNGAATAKGAVIITPEKVIVTTPGADNRPIGQNVLIETAFSP